MSAMIYFNACADLSNKWVVGLAIIQGVAPNKYAISNGLVIVADLPEEWVVERLADMLGEVYAEEHPQLTSRGSALQPRPAFTYHFPQQDEASSFAVRPSDPRYYQEVRALPDILTVPDLEVAKEPEEPQAMTTTTTTTTTTLAPELSEREQDTESGVSRSLIPATIDDTEDIYFIAIVAGCSAAAVLAVVGIGIAWYNDCESLKIKPAHRNISRCPSSPLGSAQRFPNCGTPWHRNTKAAADVEYPAYGVTGPNKEASPTGDRRLAHSAQMYHYQHQKQQILAMETSSRATSERNGSLSEADSEEENEEGDYTVYECPGPAPIGEMEVRNPLFLDDPTPATQAPTNPNSAATK
uniref:Neural proliferation differentiation and control protein 1 n=1 Tax=Timema cristinae TaxID=61476 RepID=A0A7R9GQN2_TIMCR|nr:unnamed protein product [Timema cristinae]